MINSSFFLIRFFRSWLFIVGVKFFFEFFSWLVSCNCKKYGYAISINAFYGENYISHFCIYKKWKSWQRKHATTKKFKYLHLTVVFFKLVQCQPWLNLDIQTYIFFSKDCPVYFSKENKWIIFYIHVLCASFHFGRSLYLNLLQMLKVLFTLLFSAVIQNKNELLRIVMKLCSLF